MKIVIFILIVPNKHVKRLGEKIARMTVLVVKTTIKKVVNRLLNWLED